LSDLAAFLSNAEAWLQGTPYPPTGRDPNAPHTILLFVPLTRLTLPVAVTVWMLISYACLVWTVRLIVRELQLRASGAMWCTVAAALAAAPPMLDVVVNANMLWPLGLVSTAVWLAARRRHDGVAAGLVGVLSTAKPLLGTFLIFHVARRNWRAATTFAIAALAVVALGVLLAGVDAWAAWFGAVRRVNFYDVASNASFMGLIARAWQPSFLLWLSVSAVLGLVMILTVRRWAPDVDRDWMFVILSSLLMAPLGWRYYLCLGLGPLVALLMRSSLTPRARIALLLAAWSPSVQAKSWGPIAQATVGSIPFWFVLIGWIQLRREPDRTSAAGVP